MEVCYPLGNDLSRGMLPTRAFTPEVTNPILSAMKLISKPSENYAELRQAFVKLVNAEKLKGNGQAVIAEAIEVLPNYVSNIFNGRKGLGDEVIAKIDEKYPGWRDVTESNEADAKPRNVEQKPISSGDAYWDTLLYCYEGMSNAHREALAMLANTLYSIDKPNDRKATPWVGIEKRGALVSKSGKTTFLGNLEEKQRREDAKRSKDSGVQKQGVD